MPLKPLHKLRTRTTRIKNALLRILPHKETTRSSRSLAVNQVLSAKETGALPSPAQMKYLPKLLSATERRIAAFAVIVFLTTAALLTVRLINTQRIVLPAIGGEYTEGLIGTPQLINPLYASTSDVDSDLANLIYSGLMRYDNNEGLVLDLAESYEVSEDHTVYTFVIRENATWHDGEPVRAEDVIFTVSAIQNMEYRSPLDVSFGSVTVEQVDERTVRFTLDEAFSPFLSVLTVGVLPSHLWQGINPLNATVTELNKKPIGSGPYKFEKFKKDSKGNILSYTLLRHDDYHGETPKIERLHFKFYPDVISAVEALRNHNVEGVAYLPVNEVSHFKYENDVALHFPALTQYTAAFINQSNNSVLADDDVRMALAQAVHREQIVDTALYGHGQPISSFILEGMVGEYPDLAIPAYDVDAAKQTLEDAGWILEEGASVRTKSGTELAFEIVALNATELETAASLLAEQWGEIGANVTVRTVSATDFQSDVLKNRNYDILLSGELYGIDPDPYAFWHSSQTTSPGLNLTGFSNRNADALITTGRTTADQEERAEAYRELQEMVNEENAAIFLYQPKYSYATAAKIKNVEMSHLVVPADRFSNITDWYIKTKRIFSRGPEEEVEEVPEEDIEEQGPEEEAESEEETPEEEEEIDTEENS